jgi:uncharacterized protein (TIGR02118 family)
MVKMSVLYGQPKDPAAFEKYYAETHMPLVSKMQGVSKIELSKVVGTPDGREAAFYRMADLYFNNDHDMKRVLDTSEAKATVADLANFATGGVTVLISEVV